MVDAVYKREMVDAATKPRMRLANADDSHSLVG
jgi:hypothetical protein